jgi:hypothetical protein
VRESPQVMREHEGRVNLLGTEMSPSSWNHHFHDLNGYQHQYHDIYEIDSIGSGSNIIRLVSIIVVSSYSLLIFLFREKFFAQHFQICFLKETLSIQLNDIVNVSDSKRSGKNGTETIPFQIHKL